MKPRLRIESLEKSFFGVQVLRHVSFEVHAGEVLGFVGENGSGKSTTMNILAGLLRPDAGELKLDCEEYNPSGRRESEALGIAFIQQELNIFANLTVEENLFLARPLKRCRFLPFIAKAKMRERARELLDMVRLNVDPQAMAGVLSAGECQLLEIARALGSDARVMIFDEPTSSLTAHESEHLFDLMGRLRTQGVALIYISHALDDVLRLSDRLVVMRDGRVTLQTPRQGVVAGDLVAAMVGRSIETLFPARGTRSKKRDGQPLLTIDHVSEPRTVDDITFAVHAGEVVGVSGLMGAGRSELARILFGLDSHRAGRVLIDGKSLNSGDVQARLDAGIAFLTEDRRHEGLMLEATCAQNMALAALPLFTSWRGGRLQRQNLLKNLEAMSTQLNIKSGPIEKTPVRTLSGGNQQKVVLGRWLLRTPRLFILDEPTRGVDVGAKEEIYRLLVQMADEGMAVLIISSEIEELMGLSDRILVMRHGRLQAEFARSEFDRAKLLMAAFGQRDAA